MLEPNAIAIDILDQLQLQNTNSCNRCVVSVATGRIYYGNCSSQNPVMELNKCVHDEIMVPRFETAMQPCCKLGWTTN
jgi:hypothetical protein